MKDSRAGDDVISILLLCARTDHESGSEQLAFHIMYHNSLLFIPFKG